MKLLTHNMLASNVKGVQNGYPLKLTVTKLEEREAEFQADFLRNMLARIEYGVLYETAASIGLGDQLPGEPRPADEEFLRKLHHVLLEVEVVEGSLICPETGRVFPIVGGIPNMLLNEDEV